MARLQHGLLEAQVQVDLEHGGVVAGVVGLCPEKTVPSDAAERTGAADDGELSDFVGEDVPGQHGDGAAVVRPGSEHHVEAEEEGDLRLGREDVEALRAADGRRRRVRPRRQRVVDGVHVAEAVPRVGRHRPGARCHEPCRHVQGVVHVHRQMCAPLGCVTGAGESRRKRDDQCELEQHCVGDALTIDLVLLKDWRRVRVFLNARQARYL